MARVRMVTRTVTMTKVTVMCVKVSTATVSTETYEFSGTYDNATALTAVKAMYETDDFKPSAVLAIESKDVLYGIPETEFIKVAKVLPLRTTD